MTDIEKAINWVKSQDKNDCSKCIYESTDDCDKDFCIIDNKAMDILIEAAETRIPKKPRIKRGQVCDSKVCPSCGSFYIYTADNEKAHYCNTCGQHIDWSE